MKLFLFTALLSLSIATQADPQRWMEILSQGQACQNFVRADDQFVYLGLGSYRNGFENPRKPIPGKVVLHSVKINTDPSVLHTLDGALDLVRVGSRLWILTFSGLELWDLETKTRIEFYPTTVQQEYQYKQNPEAMKLVGHQLLIAHGRLGLVVFDTNLRRSIRQIPLVQSQLPKESQATDLEIVGDQILVLMDSFTLKKNPKDIPAFQGIVKLNLHSFKVESELVGLDPGADSLIATGADLFVSYMGMPLWKYDLSEVLKSSRLPKNPRLIFKFEFPGHPTGLPVIVGDNYLTCFLNQATEPGQYATRSTRVLKKQ